MLSNSSLDPALMQDEIIQTDAVADSTIAHTTCTMVGMPMAEELQTGPTPQPQHTRQPRTIDRRLFLAYTLLVNGAEDEEIRPLLEAKGYGATDFAEGQALYDNALTLHRAVHALQGQKQRETKAFTTAWQRARFAYTRDLRVARRVFAEDPDAVRELLLRGERKRSFATWFGQISHFYAQLLAKPDYLAKLDRVGLRQATLAEHQQLVADVLPRQLQRERTKGAAKQRRRERDVALRQLDQWVMALRAVAEVALADKPALLTKLTLPEHAAVPAVTPSTTTEEMSMPPVLIAPG